jgi:ABC-type phosphonate transport system ATPase subunit
MSTETTVRLAGVSKRYGPVTALDGAGFQLRRGETVAVLGRAGPARPLHGSVRPVSVVCAVTPSPSGRDRAGGTDG